MCGVTKEAMTRVLLASHHIRHLRLVDHKDNFTSFDRKLVINQLILFSLKKNIFLCLCASVFAVCRDPAPLGTNTDSYWKLPQGAKWRKIRKHF